MSRKHFQAIAHGIRQIENPEERNRAALAMANVCAQFCARFDRARFMSACGVEQ